MLNVNEMEVRKQFSHTIPFIVLWGYGSADIVHHHNAQRKICLFRGEKLAKFCFFANFYSFLACCGSPRVNYNKQRHV